MRSVVGLAGFDDKVIKPGLGFAVIVPDIGVVVPCEALARVGRFVAPPPCRWNAVMEADTFCVPQPLTWNCSVKLALPVWAAVMLYVALKVAGAAVIDAVEVVSALRKLKVLPIGAVVTLGPEVPPLTVVTTTLTPTFGLAWPAEQAVGLKRTRKL